VVVVVVVVLSPLWRWCCYNGCCVVITAVLL